MRDANNIRLGKVDRVNRDGSVQLIVGSSFVTVPADKLSVTNGVVKVAMTKRELARMR